MRPLDSAELLTVPKKTPQTIGGFEAFIIHEGYYLHRWGLAFTTTIGARLAPACELALLLLLDEPAWVLEEQVRHGIADSHRVAHTSPSDFQGGGPPCVKDVVDLEAPSVVPDDGTGDSGAVRVGDGLDRNVALDPVEYPLDHGNKLTPNRCTCIANRLWNRRRVGGVPAFSRLLASWARIDAEACGVDEPTLLSAFEAAAAAVDYRRACYATRRIIPWEMLSPAFASIDKASSGRMRPTGITRKRRRPPRRER